MLATTAFHLIELLATKINEVRGTVADLAFPQHQPRTHSQQVPRA
jgi:hypothetical protein